MSLSVNGPGRVAPANSQPQTVEELVADLVRFVESKPTAAQVAAKLPEVQANPNGIRMLMLIAGMAPIFDGVTAAQRPQLLDKCSRLLEQVRSEVKAGGDLQRARDRIGMINDREGALLASAIDTPLKLDAMWAFITMSAIQARAK